MKMHALVLDVGYHTGDIYLTLFHQLFEWGAGGCPDRVPCDQIATWRIWQDCSPPVTSSTASRPTS